MRDSDPENRVRYVYRPEYWVPISGNPKPDINLVNPARDSKSKDGKVKYKKGQPLRCGLVEHTDYRFVYLRVGYSWFDYGCFVVHYALSHFTFFRYVIEGCVFRSERTPYPLSSFERRETSLSESFKLPKTIAFVGQAWAQAGVISPSLTSLPSSFALSSPKRILCTQNVHFSITPLVLTVTSGFNCQLRGSGHLYVNQLKRLTLYTQLFEQYLVPTHRLYTITLRPSGL